MKIRIRKLVGWLVAQAFAVMGRRRKALAVYRHHGNVLSIFGHSPRIAVLDGMLGWLVRHGFHFVSTDELLDMRDGKCPWQPLTAWLTFDDGWAGFESELLPILRKYNVPATIFVAPHETERGQVWTNSVRRYVSNMSGWYDLPSAERDAKIDAVLKDKPKVRTLADEAELKRLVATGLVALENHTLTHLSCSHRPVSEIETEIVATNAILREWTGREPRLLCYPFGHWNEASDELALRLGLCPVKCSPGVMSIAEIGARRNMFHDVMSNAENVGRVLGAWPAVNVVRA